MQNANIAALNYHKMLTSKNMKLNKKTKVYKIYIKPILLYNCKTWNTSKSDLKSIEVIEGKFEKDMSDILLKLDLK